MCRPESYQSFGHAPDDKVTLWVYRAGRLETRDGTGACDHDTWWDMSAVLAFGRVCGHDGSLVIESTARPPQRMLANALVGRFPGVRFWVWTHEWRGAKGMQEWWTHISEEAA